MGWEIDLKYIKSIVKKFKIDSSKVDCYPLIWFQLNVKKSEEFTMHIKQRVAFKYVVIKCLDRLMTSGTTDQANIDMYPVEFRGMPLPIPCENIAESGNQKPEQKQMNMKQLSTILKDLKDQEKELEK